MSASDLVKEWREKAQRKAAEKAAQSPPVPVTFAGFTGKAHRLYLMDWARAGKLPQYLAQAMFLAVQGKDVEKKREDLTPEELADWLKFQCVCFCSMMDEPKFSSEIERQGRELRDDEMDYGEFVAMCPEAVSEAVQWQLNGCPDIPVQTEGGEMTLEELTTFRDRGGWLTSSESFYHSEGVFWDTKPLPRVI